MRERLRGRCALWLALLALAGWLCGCAGERAQKPAAPPAPAAMTASAAARPGLFYYGRSLLDGGEQEAYDLVCARLEGWALGEVPLDPALPDGGMERVWSAVVADRPDFYWADCAYPEAGTVSAVTLGTADGLTVEQARERRRKLEAAADALLAGVGGPGTEVAAAVHDALLGVLDYEYGVHDADSGNVYGALVRGRGVCGAYSRGYQYLMQRAGIPCFHISEVSGRGIPHSWVAVLLEDGWYYVDPTWDDLPDERGYLYHDYLLVTKAEMDLNHSADPSGFGTLPKADSDRLNYYRYYGYCVDPAQGGDPIEALAAGFARQLEDKAGLLAELPQPVFLEVKVLGSYEDYLRVRAQFERDLFPLLEALSRRLSEDGLPIGVETTGQVLFSGNDNTQVLTLRPRAFRTEEERSVSHE